MTTKINLPSITLVALTGLGYKSEEHQEAIKKSCEQIDFAEAFILEIPSVVDVASWNEAIIFELPKHINTDYCMLIHHDGYVINGELWDPTWLNYDYIGAPWPLPQDGYSYRDEEGNLVRVGNSVSLRSKKLMDLIATRPMEYHYGNNNEDGHICCWNRKWLENEGCVFAPFEEAIYFSKEHVLPENERITTFAFHAL